MVWAWMLQLPCALETRTLLWFGHGCSSYRMLSKHERYYGLGMDVPVTVCSRNTNVVMVWARMLQLPCALETRTLLWFGHGCSRYRKLSKHERYCGVGMDAPVTVCSRNTNVIMVWAWMLQLPYALETRTLLSFGHGCSSYRVLSKHERYYGLGMDAPVIVCSRNTNVIMVWAWMLQLPCALETRTLLWFGHGCSSYRMLSKHERCYGLGMDAPVTVCSRNTNVIMVWAWMLQLSCALETRTLLWFGHGCSSYRVLSKHERYYGLGMGAPVIVCSRNTNVIMVSVSYAHPACSAVIMTRCLAPVDASTSGARSKWPPVSAGFSRALHMALEPCAKL